MNARLLRSLIAERVSPGAGAPGPGADWAVGRCRHCDEPIWLASAWVDVLAGDPEAVASCFDCAHALVEEPASTIH